MTITETVAVAGNLRNAEPYMCSCGDKFVGLALLETHLDLLGDDSDAHVELAVVGDRCKRRVALGIRRVRFERGLPMREMGALLGVNTSTISRIESGERRFGYLLVNPRVTAALLGISLVDLLRPCPQCGYKPLGGYLCQSCGTYGERA
ncbi:MAG TPA: helix-turn-helix domain-containing protein [Streptosporangiaceae bacterium]|nr:helix-turn-helix domain-containing protein [Streptosporangiaceae bacterium]